MFVSYFPKPKLFFISAVVWALLAVLVLVFLRGSGLGSVIGLPPLPPGQEAPIGVSVFWSAAVPVVLHLLCRLRSRSSAGFWFAYSPHRWQMWSVLGSALIIFNTYFSVQS